MQRELEQRRGDPHRRYGRFDDDALDSVFRTAAVHDEDADRSISLAATHIPSSGVVIRERYVAQRPVG